MLMMMGIKSRKLYEKLTSIVVEGDVSVFEKTQPSELFPDLIVHLSQTIPQDIFQTSTDHDDLNIRLTDLGRYLEAKFAMKNQYPFTMQRICELCYHPLKYFRTPELEKFVNALEKCCMVSSSWDRDEVNKHEEVADAGDVSLSKIPWLDETQEHDLGSFIKEIETVVSVNFGYENDDDEDLQTRDVIIKDYYDEDEDDEADADYEEEAEDAEEVEEEEEEEEGEDEEDKLDDDVTVETNPTEDSREGTITSDADDLEMPEAIRKRKPTELDDYKYESRESPGDTTPKKQRSGTNTSVLTNSPSIARSAGSQNASLEQQISMLISPKSMSETMDKAVATTDHDENGHYKETSPLISKTKRLNK